MQKSLRSLMVSIISILLGFLFGAILMLFSGINPIEGFLFLFQGALNGITRASNTVAYAVPLMLTGLSVAFAFKTGLFNIGAPGQMLIGGLFANVYALTVVAPRYIMLPTVIILSMLGGMIWASIPGFLKAFFNANEVVSCIMMNWIAYWTVYIIVSENFKSLTNVIESTLIPESASLRTEFLTEITGGSYLNLSIIIAIIATIIISIILNKTVLGYELKAVGYNRFSAEYGGISVNKSIVVSMAISGLLSGLAGLALYFGYLSNMRIGVMPSQGFDGIAVALLANSNPIGVIFSALFFSILQTGKGFMNAMLPIPPELADIIIAIVIYFSATSKLIEMNLDKIVKFFKKTANKAGGKKHVGNN